MTTIQDVKPSVFIARYQLACFYVANYIFETVILTDDNINLEGLSSLQRDHGFFMASLRLIEQLTAFSSEQDLLAVREKVINSKSMYFKKSMLLAVVNSLPKTASQSGPQSKQKVLTNVYDEYIVNTLYNSYFSSYTETQEELSYLDVPATDPSNLVSLFELGVFDATVLNTVSDILDFSTTTILPTVENVISALENNPRYSVYQQFFKILRKCLI